MEIHHPYSKQLLKDVAAKCTFRLVSSGKQSNVNDVILSVFTCLVEKYDFNHEQYDFNHEQYDDQDCYRALQSYSKDSEKMPSSLIHTTLPHTS